MTARLESALPPPPGEAGERDWEQRRRVALEAWKLGQKLASTQNRAAAGIRRQRFAPQDGNSEVGSRYTPLWRAQHRHVTCGVS